MKYFMPFKKLILFSFFYSGMPIFLYAGMYSGPDTPDENVRLSFTAIKPKMLQTFDVSALNLKNTQPQHSVTQTNSAITIGYSDFNTISSIGNT